MHSYMYKGKSLKITSNICIQVCSPQNGSHLMIPDEPDWKKQPKTSEKLTF